LNQIDELYEEQEFNYKKEIESLKSTEGFSGEILHRSQKRANQWFYNLPIFENCDDLGENITYHFSTETIDANTYEGQLRLLKNDVDLYAQLRNEYCEYLFYSLCCYELSRFFYNNEDKSKGCKCLFDAIYYLGRFLGGYIFNDYVSNMVTTNAEKSSKGGKAKAKNVDPVKKEFIRLLKGRMPESGWESMTEARIKLANELWLFIKEEKTTGLKWSALLETLKRWSEGKKADPEIRATFDEVLRKKRRVS